MVHLEEMPRPYWRMFLDFLSNKSVIILRDWSTKLFMRVGIFMYDYGVKIPNDNVSEGSFTSKKVKGGEKDDAKDVQLGKAGALIWRSNQVHMCEVYFDVHCCTSIEAEAKRMYLQLKRGMPLQFLFAYIDYMTVYNAVR